LFRESKLWQRTRYKYQVAEFKVLRNLRLQCRTVNATFANILR
jgi:hypothetical protein